jgi:hypothetical protein
MAFHRRIPRVAAAALVFGGCSTEESNVDAEERATLDAYATSYCATLEDCDLFGFGYAYPDGQDQCIDAIYAPLVDRIEDATSGYGEACGDALIDYATCIANAIASDCYADPYTYCADLSELGYELCGGG